MKKTLLKKKKTINNKFTKINKETELSLFLSIDKENNRLMLRIQTKQKVLARISIKIFIL